jgi:hypothetical protein
MNNKLMDIYDEQYNDTFNQMLDNGTDRQEAKNIMGLIFQNTLKMITKKDNTRESIETIFNQTRMQYGLC